LTIYSGVEQFVVTGAMIGPF